MRYRQLLCTLAGHVGFLAVAATLDPWYTSLPATVPAVFWCVLPRFLSLFSLSAMALCGLKNPGKLRTLKGREVVLERLTQHMKNMSTSSLDCMVEQTSQIVGEAKVELKPVMEEIENPYDRIEVELGSDSFRAQRISEQPCPPSESVSAVAVSQAPTVPIKCESQPPPALLPEAKQFPDATCSPFTRFCPVCSVDQILRSKHCNVCQVCVATYDHHCPWLGTCIGEKNRLLFLAFLTGIMGEVGIGFTHCICSELRTGAQYSVLVVFSVAGLLLICLYIHHLFLIWRNLTTWEFLAKSRITYLKDWPSRWQSPFNKGFVHTLKVYIRAFPARAPFIIWELPEDHQKPSLSQTISV